MAKQKYVDLAGLQVFKGLIEGKISEGDAKSLKTVLFDAENRKINFYKKNAATSADVADFSIILPEEQDISGLLEKISSGTKDNIVTIGEDGIVIDSGVAIADIATKDEVEAVDEKVGDVTKLSTTAKTDVVVAINEVKESVESSSEAGVVTIETTSTTKGALKSYTVKQGGTTIGVIDIPKDMVVTEGSVVVNPDGEEAGTYIKLVIANQDEPLLINVGKLVDIYTVKKNATQIQLAIDESTREISAAIVAGSVSSVELADDAVTTVKIADANVTLAKLAVDVKNAFDSAGSATAAETNAKKYADGLNEAMDTRVTSVEEKVGDGFEAVSAEEINALFAE
ncbi:MAG: hypothetical protein NC489_22925 [Ruminococcus flavefaciens]|nr:hypothetical protein [Ruminococcus flavefaciens]